MIDPHDSQIVRVACKLLVPFVQVFGVYVLVHGHESPGGGFQGGAILAASLILLRFTQEEDVGRRWARGDAAIRLGAAGVAIFLAVGLLPWLGGGAVLDYGELPLPGTSAAGARWWGILVIEVGVCVAVAGVLVSIFDDLAPPVDGADADPAGTECDRRGSSSAGRSEGERA